MYNLYVNKYKVIVVVKILIEEIKQNKGENPIFQPIYTGLNAHLRVPQ